MNIITCRNCIYESVCPNYDSYDDVLNVSDYCPNFKNKTDFVEVIRCKDCDIIHNEWMGCPHLNGLIPPPMFYCAYGERRADND